MNQFSFLPNGNARYNGMPDDYVRLIIERQLKDANAWKHFVEVYRNPYDTCDNGWRGEYWGKLMRGACLIYTYTKDESVYAVLENAVRELLKSQDPLGRFSPYSANDEFRGWDMWSRKYVLTGMQHFFDICHDEALKEEIVCALKKHADYIISKIGNGPGQIPINQTSQNWLGVNSSSILEPFVRLYDMTKEQRYLDFAKYIIDEGGCSGGNLISLALAGEKMPFEYPEVKAYETISFFEGVLAYADITGNETYRKAVLQFVDAVADTDITVIGCAGCTHELFDNSAKKQTEWSEIIMQETCVTVTWMRMLSRLFLATGDVRYANRLERSVFNALYGSINTKWCTMIERHSGKTVQPMMFDSYSPLYNNCRGVGVGGFKIYPDGFYYGCCVCIGAAGIALAPLMAVLQGKGSVCVNFLLDGAATVKAPSGADISLQIQSAYPKAGNATITLSMAQEEAFALRIRIPDWCKSYSITCGEESYSSVNGYATIFRTWHTGDTVAVALEMPLIEQKLNGRTAFSYGALVLARDEHKEQGSVDLTEEITLARSAEGAPIMQWKEPAEGETVRLSLQKEDGSSLLLSDYASCGKYWNDKNNKLTVWMNVK